MDMDGEMYSKLWGKQSELRKKKKGLEQVISTFKSKFPISFKDNPHGLSVKILRHI